MIKISKFFEYDKYTISAGDLEAEIISLGATVTSLKFKGQETVLSYQSAQEYMQGSAYICAAIGRYGNRIGSSAFQLNGQSYRLVANEGKNQLHGGPMSWDKRVWQAQPMSDNSIRFSILSPDGDNGFPGEMTATIAQQPAEMGYLSVMTAVAALKGETVEKVVSVPTVVIDASTVADYLN